MKKLICFVLVTVICLSLCTFASDTQEYITRGEFAVMVNALAPRFEGEGKVFPDIENSACLEAVRNLSAGGVINGFTDGTFRPNSPISKQDAYTMAGRAFGLRYNVSDIYDISDAGNIADYAYDYINALYYYYLIDVDKDLEFKPRTYFTAKEAEEFMETIASIKNTGEIIIDAKNKGKIITNKVSNVNMWAMDDWAYGIRESVPDDYYNNEMPFIEYVQLMTATGGEASRDLFEDPNNRDVLDDYKFDKLLLACEGIVNKGLKPLIKTGNIPLKFTTDPIIGTFGVNVLPPDDYNVYYNYIKAIATALVDKFGLDEVCTWRFGCFTEYENRDWFTINDDAEATFIAYCKIYDYTAAALQDVLGEEIDIGAHSMSCADGLWDEARFIKHAAKEKNYATGKIGTRLTYLNVSFYDSKPSSLSKRTLQQTIDIVRDAAIENGLANLRYGVDEGRILCGMEGVDLLSRSVGQTWQASYDAREIKQMIDNDIDFFSRWAYTASGITPGVPSVAMHTSNMFYRMVNSEELPVIINNTGFDRKNEINAFSGVDENGKISLMTYNFSVGLTNTKAEFLKTKINNLENGEYIITKWEINDYSNFYDDWEKDFTAAELTNNFGWSKDCFVALSGATLPNEADRSFFLENEAKYYEKAKLTPVETVVSVTGGTLTLDFSIMSHAVTYMEITKKGA